MSPPAVSLGLRASPWIAGSGLVLGQDDLEVFPRNFNRAIEIQCDDDAKIFSRGVEKKVPGYTLHVIGTYISTSR